VFTPLLRLFFVLVAFSGAGISNAADVPETCVVGAWTTSCTTDAGKENYLYNACLAVHGTGSGFKCATNTSIESLNTAAGCQTAPPVGAGKVGYYTVTGGQVCNNTAWQLIDTWLVVDACAATANQSLSGTVSRTGAPSASNPPPQEVCHESCIYDLSTAVPATGLDGTELWSGTWIGRGEGGACSGGATPNPGGNTSEGAAAGAATAPATAAETAYDSGLAALDGSSSPLGSWWSLPSWVTGLLTRQTTDCKLHIDVPAGGVLGSVRERLQNIDVCGVQQYADTFGNWFMWFCALLWSWVIVTGGRTDSGPD